MSIESVMPTNHRILCCPLLLLPSIFPSIRVCCHLSPLLNLLRLLLVQESPPSQCSPSPLSWPSLLLPFSWASLFLCRVCCAMLSHFSCVRLCVTYHNFFFFFNDFIFWLYHAVCGILVSRPGIKPVSRALEARNLNHWVTREVPHIGWFILRFQDSFSYWLSHAVLTSTSAPSDLHKSLRYIS